jgi:hypothetical protein
VLLKRLCCWIQAIKRLFDHVRTERQVRSTLYQLF